MERQPVLAPVSGTEAAPLPAEGFCRDLVENLFDGVYFVDLERRITYWNRGAERITGYRAEEVIGSRCADNLLVHVDESGVQLCREGCPLEATCRDGRLREARVFLRHRGGHRVPVLVRASPIRDGQGRIIGAAEVFSDVSAQAEAQWRAEELEKLALLDHLTGAANRRYMEILLAARLGELERYGWPLGVLFADVDRFKELNDAFGHAAGDRTLALVARTLASGARSFDVVGRWGGEEFLVLLVNVTGAELEEIAERLRLLVESSRLPIASGDLHLTVSIGATLAVPGDTPEALVGRADALMYRSKHGGRNRVTTDLGTQGTG
ncbi:MAG: sensor domain-containing diguanylate cyclase, partial [Thermodesulfobacteriota bacterium]